jgi:hypothetical protein
MYPRPRRSAPGSEHHLFSQGPLGDALLNQMTQCRNEIASLDPDGTLNTPEAALVERLVDKYEVVCPQLDADNITVEHAETEIDLTRQLGYMPFPGAATRVPGSAVTYHIPYTGDAAVFDCYPNPHDSARRPDAVIRDHEIAITYQDRLLQADQLRTFFQHDLGRITAFLEGLCRESEQFNKDLRATIEHSVAARREKILSDKGIVASPGYKLHVRAGAPTTYVLPKRKPRPVIDDSARKPFAPEPMLDIAEYDHILEILQSMVIVIEQSPRAFRDMSEEDLRQHFLVQLNGHYAGDATGETFNYSGKTDILIRANKSQRVHCRVQDLGRAFIFDERRRSDPQLRLLA